MKDRTLRIIYVAPEKLTADRAPALQLLHTVRELANAHSPVELVTPWPAAFVRRRASELTGHEMPKQLRIVCVGSGPNLPLLSHLWPSQVWAGVSHRLIRYLQRIHRRDESAVVYTRNRRAAAVLGRHDCPPLIFEYHEPESITARQMDADDARVEQLRNEELAGVCNAAALVTVGRAHAEQAPQLYGYHGPAFAIPNGADPNAFSRPAGNRKVRPGHFLYVGSLAAWKGLPLALRAVARIPDAVLHVCGGEKSTSTWNEIQQLGRELRISDRLKMHGHVSHTRLRPWLETAQAGILPIDGRFAIAEKYTCPLKLLEYMTAGLPCIATDLPSIRELVTNECEALLVPPGDVAETARAMQRLISNPELAGRLASGAQKKAADYTWEKRAERVLAVCAAVLAEERRSRQVLPFAEHLISHRPGDWTAAAPESRSRAA